MKRIAFLFLLLWPVLLLAQDDVPVFTDKDLNSGGSDMEVNYSDSAVSDNGSSAYESHIHASGLDPGWLTVSGITFYSSLPTTDSAGHTYFTFDYDFDVVTCDGVPAAMMFRVPYEIQYSDPVVGMLCIDDLNFVLTPNDFESHGTNEGGTTVGVYRKHVSGKLQKRDDCKSDTQKLVLGWSTPQ